eukprot:CAMPEP_0172453934 /NCGR_PEP_ID=MMETSP1065-20121228/11071_1 /TAXON_ID=265537 /ORGANISM="Amphiprora paludosa, Strain CCMP125" /LENGTH=233 /DNA_ID=CAMNT_0013206181 /DNA_START=89 /DNA_END=790 /DNA_ORIENTATION=-
MKLFVTLIASGLMACHAFQTMVAPSSCHRPAASTCLFSQEDGNAPEEGAPTDSGASDILNSPAFLQRKLEVLQSDIAKVEADTEEARARLEAGKAEWGGQLDELQKEYQNIQERLNSQNKQGDTMAIVQVTREMLKVLDNYDRAFGAVTPSGDIEAEIEADYKSTWDDIMQTFSDLGVEEIKTVGVEFDYEVHQAVMQKPSDEYEEGIVCEEFQKGFKIGDTLIRASMVAVAA